MQQTKPLFVIKKYRKILLAAIVVEAVNYVVSLTDSIVAGNVLGSSALAAIGLIAPFSSVAVFVSSIVNSGTVMQYSEHVGRFEKLRALDFFSQGVYLALLTGAVYAGALFLCRDPILTRLGGSAEIQTYARSYFNIILLLFFIFPISFVLDNLLIADGNEKISAVGNVLTIVANVSLSLLFSRWWGIRGIALATVLSRMLFFLTACLHFFSKKNTLRLVLRWSWRDCLTIVRSGIVKATTYAFEALAVFLLNLIVVRCFDDGTLVLMVMAEKFLGLMTLFIGLSMAAQPLISTLYGERNDKALRMLMKTVCLDMTVAGAVLTLLTQLFSSQLVTSFGITAGALHADGVVVLRIVSSTLMFQAVMTLFFIYFYLIGRQGLAFIVVFLKNLVFPVSAAFLLAVPSRNRIGLWIGLAAAPVLSLLVCALFVLVKYHAAMFPFLLSRAADDKTFIFSFEVNENTAVAMSQTAIELLGVSAVSNKQNVMVGLFIEEMLLLIRNRNAGRKKLTAECTILLEDDGIRLILRDSGVLFDITDEDAIVDSFQQYFVANLMRMNRSKTYLTTTGYNRSELFFPYA